MRYERRNVSTHRLGLIDPAKNQGSLIKRIHTQIYQQKNFGSVFFRASFEQV